MPVDSLNDHTWVLYVGDSKKKFLHVASQKLGEIGLADLAHEELPDVVAYSSQKRWLFLIEAVHSSGPTSALRVAELERWVENCTAGIVYVTAFRDKKSFRKWACDIAWETEAWVAESPDHMIHFNGDKFLGPYQNGALGAPADEKS